VASYLQPSELADGSAILHGILNTCSKNDVISSVRKHYCVFYS